MSSAGELGLPDQFKARGREIRRKQHTAWSESYETEHKLEDRPRNVLEEKLLSRLESDLPACELLLALFASAASSSRRHTVCAPFPRFLIGQDGPLYEDAVRFCFGDLAHINHPFLCLVCPYSLPSAPLCSRILHESNKIPLCFSPNS